MKNKLYLVFTIAVLLLASMVIKAQKESKSEASIRFKDGLTVVFTSETEPLDAARKPIGSLRIRGENNVIQRVLIDEERGVYFGYDLLVEPIAETGPFKLTFQPLSVQPNNVLQPNPPRRPLKNASGGKVASPDDGGRQVKKLLPLSVKKYPAAQIVRDGDTIVFDVLVNSKTGLKIVDLIKVMVSAADTLPAISQEGSAFGSSDRPAKDFSVDEVEFNIVSSKLAINGTAVSGASGESGIGISGALVWFYVPRQGRFILSLAPRKGFDFHKTGTVYSNKINFSMNGNQYEWMSGFPIISGANDKWNLYVLHQSDYMPDFAGARPDSYLFGAAARIENLIRKK